LGRTQRFRGVCRRAPGTFGDLGTLAASLLARDTERSQRTVSHTAEMQELEAEGRQTQA